MSRKSFSDMISGFPCANQLAGIGMCAKAVVSVGDIQVPQYTYSVGNKLYIAENLDGKWELREETDLHTTVRDLGVLLGDSPVSRTEFLITLPPEEAACLLAVMDLRATAVLLGAAGSETGNLQTPDLVSIREALSNPRKNGLLTFLNAVFPNLRPNAEDALCSLADKDICRLENGRCVLTARLGALADALALPLAAVSMCLWENEGGEGNASPTVAVQGTLHDILVLTVGKKEIAFCSLSSKMLLDLIEETLSCPGAPGPAAAGNDTANCPVCSAPLAPGSKFCTNCGRETEPPSPAPRAEGTWICSCGQENTGAFCTRCGAGRPETSQENLSWQCACGRINTGAFCPKCGARRP